MSSVVNKKGEVVLVVLALFGLIGVVALSSSPQENGIVGSAASMSGAAHGGESAAPATMWTGVFAAVFVIVLVGGVALARYRHLSLDKPPTEIRTGLDLTSETGLPQASSEVSRPVLSSFEDQQKMRSQAALQSTARTQNTRKVVKKHVVISEMKRLELQRYIYRALGAGFEEPAIREVLVDHGWPKEVVVDAFERMRRMDKKIESADLSSQNIQLTQAMEAIKQLRTQGTSKEEISAALVSKGWKSEVVDQLMKNIS
ncbi:hypothetical protein HY772_00930 [Candidatus Woesearchaeota archaeon]|nr:hypothetical protein [Candidatus Woesearchaeota archaeon]